MPENHNFKKGECLDCIAEEKHLVGSSVWSRSENSALRLKRGDKGRIAPGDVVLIPDPRPKEVGRATDQVHKFVLKKGPHPHWIEIELIDENDKPVPGTKFKVKFANGVERVGTLDQNGWARVEGIPKEPCEVSFPEIDDAAWKPLETAGPKSA